MQREKEMPSSPRCSSPSCHLTETHLTLNKNGSTETMSGNKIIAVVSATRFICYAAQITRTRSQLMCQFLWETLPN